MTTPLVRASEPERLVYNDLRRRGHVEGVTFRFQETFFGVGREKGVSILDFYFLEPPGLAINVQGEYFHYEQGADVIARDRLLRAQMATYNVHLIFIDAEDVLQDVSYYVDKALNYQDLSSLGRG